MRHIPLTRGLSALVDDCDYDRVNSIRWNASPVTRSGNFYAATSINGRTTYMHRLILDAPAGTEVDHINRNGLDNRRSNLRLCNRRQNCANCVPDKRAKSGFIGVYMAKHGRYRALVQLAGKNIHGGYFDTSEEAALARDDIAIRVYGEFATLNFPRAA